MRSCWKMGNPLALSSLTVAIYSLHVVNVA